MKTAIEKPVTPSGVFDHLMVPQGDEPEFHPSKDPKTMTMQEFLEEVDRFLCWNRMTPEEKRAEQEAQRAASHATEQAAGDIPCTMRPERVPDTPQDTVWEDLTDAPQDVVRADMLDTSMDGMLEAVPSNGAPERAADTMLDDVPDATEGNVPGREADTVPDGPPDDLPDTVEGNMPDVVGALTAQEKAGNETVQGVPEVEVVPPEAIVLLEQTGEDVPAAEERWAYGKIANIKFVCGPLGGGESLPNGLKDYAKGHEIIEVVRSEINRWYRFKLRITGKLNRCDYIMFANKETQEFLVGGAELNCPYELVFDNGLRPDELVNWTEKEKVNEELQCK